LNIHHDQNPDHNTKEAPIKCEECGASFFTNTGLKQHIWDYCEKTFKDERNGDWHEATVSHVKVLPTSVPASQLGYSSFRAFSLSIVDQADLLGEGFDDDGAIDGADGDIYDDYKEEEENEKGTLNASGVEGAGGIDGEGSSEVVDINGKDFIDAIPSGEFHQATVKILVDTPVGPMLKIEEVVFETGTYIPRFIIESCQPRKLFPIEISILKKLLNMGFRHEAKHDISSVCKNCNRKRNWQIESIH
ncbi:hypothetical protein BGW39_009260, partial [Mortierella sp. 14UC]